MRITILIISTIVFISCKQSTINRSNEKDLVLRKEPIIINFNNCISGEKVFLLSEIVDSLEYISLETRKDVLITNIQKVISTNDYLFLDSRGSIYQFQRNGKFIRRVGKIGKGPEEYVGSRGFTVDEKAKEVYVMSNWIRKILVYSFNGEFLRDFKFADVGTFEKRADNVFFGALWNISGQDKYRLLAINENGDTTDRFINHVKFIPKGIPLIARSDFSLNFYKYSNHLFYREDYNDTIFEIDSTNSLVPHLILELGKYKIPIEKRIESIGSEYYKYAFKYINTGVIENDKFVFITYNSFSQKYADGRARENEAALFLKSINSGYKLKTASSFGIGFKNDLDGGLDFWPNGTIKNNNLIRWIEASDLIEQIELKNHDGGENNASVFLRSFLRKIDENSNPVIIIAHVKN